MCVCSATKLGKPGREAELIVLATLNMMSLRAKSDFQKMPTSIRQVNTMRKEMGE